MGVFGRKGDEAEIRAEIDRLSSLALNDLASEIMDTLVAMDDLPRGARGPDDYEVVDAMIGRKSTSADKLDLVGVIAEGLQVLEHAGLVYPVVGLRNQSYSMNYAVTRAGAAAAAAGTVRQLVG
ncbi:MAG: hypothetical protein RIE08_13750 [Acidimicrobiales bacterium]